MIVNDQFIKKMKVPFKILIFSNELQNLSIMIEALLSWLKVLTNNKKKNWLKIFFPKMNDIFFFRFVGYFGKIISQKGNKIQSRIILKKEFELKNLF